MTIALGGVERASLGIFCERVSKLEEGSYIRARTGPNRARLESVWRIDAPDGFDSRELLSDIEGRLQTSPVRQMLLIECMAPGGKTLLDTCELMPHSEVAAEVEGRDTTAVLVNALLAQSGERERLLMHFSEKRDRAEERNADLRVENAELLMLRMFDTESEESLQMVAAIEAFSPLMKAAAVKVLGSRKSKAAPPSRQLAEGGAAVSEASASEADAESDGEPPEVWADWSEGDADDMVEALVLMGRHRPDLITPERLAPLIEELGPVVGPMLLQL